MLIPLKFYKFGTIISGAMPVLAYLSLPKTGKVQVSPLIFVWFLTRFLADTGAHIALYANQSHQFVFNYTQFTVFIEFTLMMLYFVKLKSWNREPKGWILAMIPLMIYVFEIYIGHPLMDFGELLLTVNYLVVALLFLSLMFHPSKWDRNQLIIIWSFFLYHAFFVIFGIIQTDMRSSYHIMSLIYPFFWIANIVFNLFFAYYFWTFRNSEKESVPH